MVIPISLRFNKPAKAYLNVTSWVENKANLGIL
jgi:hypothetical protein